MKKYLYLLKINSKLAFNVLSMIILLSGAIASVLLVQKNQDIRRKAVSIPMEETLYYIHSDHLGSTSVVNETDSNWTNDFGAACGFSNRLYCFQKITSPTVF